MPDTFSRKLETAFDAKSQLCVGIGPHEEVLVENGFEVINERQDLKNANKTIWLFLNSDELQKCFQKYKELYGDKKYKK